MAILKIEGYGVEHTLGTVDNSEAFDAFKESASEGELIAWDMAGDYDVEPNAYSDIINLWGIEGEDTESIDKISIIDDNETEIELDKSKIEIFLFEEPWLYETSESGYLGYSAYEKRLTAQYDLDEHIIEDLDKINIIILSVSVEEVFGFAGVSGYVSKFVLLMSDDEKQKLMSQYEFLDFDDLVHDIKENTELENEIKKFVLPQSDFEQGRPTGEMIYLFDKSGEGIYSN